MNSEDLRCRKLNVVEFILCCNVKNRQILGIMAPECMKMSCITAVVDKGSTCLSLLVVMSVKVYVCSA